MKLVWIPGKYKERAGSMVVTTVGSVSANDGKEETEKRN